MPFWLTVEMTAENFASRSKIKNQWNAYNPNKRRLIDHITASWSANWQINGLARRSSPISACRSRGIAQCLRLVQSIWVSNWVQSADMTLEAKTHVRRIRE